MAILHAAAWNGTVDQPLDFSYNVAGTVTAVTTVFIAASTIAIILRLVARRISRHRLIAEDWSILVALILTSGIYAETLLIACYSAGEATISEDKIVSSNKAEFAFKIIFPCALLAIKTSILFLYSSIFSIHDRPFKIAWYTIMCYSLAWTIAALLVTVLRCTPIQYAWDTTLNLEDGKCMSNRMSSLTIGVTNTLSNFALLLFPIPMLWQLQHPFGQRIQVLCIFLVGLFACIASIIRIQYVAKSDVSSNTAINYRIWSFIEPTTGIILACLPLFRPLTTRSARTSSNPTFTSNPYPDTHAFPDNSASFQSHRSQPWSQYYWSSPSRLPFTRAGPAVVPRWPRHSHRIPPPSPTSDTGSFSRFDMRTMGYKALGKGHRWAIAAAGRASSEEGRGEVKGGEIQVRSEFEWASQREGGSNRSSLR